MTKLTSMHFLVPIWLCAIILLTIPSPKFSFDCFPKWIGNAQGKHYCFNGEIVSGRRDIDLFNIILDSLHSPSSNRESIFSTRYLVL